MNGHFPDREIKKVAPAFPPFFFRDCGKRWCRRYAGAPACDGSWPCELCQLLAGIAYLHGRSSKMDH